MYCQQFSVNSSPFFRSNCDLILGLHVILLSIDDDTVLNEEQTKLALALNSVDNIWSVLETQNAIDHFIYLPLLTSFITPLAAK